MFRSFRDLAVLVFMYSLSKFSVQIQPLGSSAEWNHEMALETERKMQASWKALWMKEGI